MHSPSLSHRRSMERYQCHSRGHRVVPVALSLKKIRQLEAAVKKGNYEVNDTESLAARAGDRHRCACRATGAESSDLRRAPKWWDILEFYRGRNYVRRQ